MPTFLLEVEKLSGPGSLQSHLDALLRPAVEPLGYELVGIEFETSGVLRVYIDADQGITVEDCAAVSRQISGVLDVEDPIPGAYTLEVSSPGVYRPLFSAGDYERFAGERVKIRLTREYEGRRRLRGTLLGMEGESVVVLDDAERWLVPLDLVARANLDPEL